MQTKIQYQHFDEVEKLFEKLSRPNQIAFCASLSERTILNYALFDRDSQRNYLPVLRDALNEIWLLLTTDQVDLEKIKKLLESCENIMPEEDDNNLSNWLQEAAEATACVCHTLELCLYSHQSSIKSAIACVHNSLDYYLGTIISAIPYDIDERDSHRLEIVNAIPQNEIFKFIFLTGEKNAFLMIERTHKIDLDQDIQERTKEIKKIADKMIENHPLLLKEIEKENEDLRQLQESPMLTSELLQWLRTSSENGGKSFLNIC